MKTLRTLLLLFGAVLPLTIFAQVTYTFDSGGNGYFDSGTSTWTNLTRYGTTPGACSISDAATLGVTFSDGNWTKVFVPGVRSGYTSSADLTAIPSTADYQVVWKQYIKTATSAVKDGVLLRGQSVASGYSTQVRKGYLFTATSTGTAGQIRFRIMKFDATNTLTDLNSAYITPAGYTTGPIYVKAVAQGTTLTLYYSLNNSTWTQVAQKTGAADYTSGVTQITWGMNGNDVDMYFDDITFTDLTPVDPSVSITGYDKYTYTGSAQGPSSATYANFTSTPTLTYAYEGLGSTTYASNSTPPSQPGIYKATVTATYAAQTATNVMAYEILSANYDKVYTFNDDAVSTQAANTSYNNAIHQVSNFGAVKTLATDSKGKYLVPNGNAVTNLNQFGTINNISGNYSVVWKDYASATGQKRAFILRGDAANTFQLINNNTVNVGKGYMFYVNNTSATNFQLDIRKLNLTDMPTTLISAATNTVTATVNVATWYKATVNGTTLTFQYSTDGGATWITACTTTDDSFSNGVTQLSAINSGGSSYGIDYVAFDNLASAPSVVLEQKDKFVYSGSAQGPSSSIGYDFTGNPAVSVTYEGVGSTVYASSSTAPTEPGTYLATASATNNAESATDTQAFEILSLTSMDQYPYAFSSHTIGNAASGISYRSNTSGTVSLAYYTGTSPEGKKTGGLMLKPLLSGTSNNTGVVTLSSIPSSNNYSIVWKEYVTVINGQKKGVLIQSQTDTCSYAVGMKRGYLFLVNNDATNGTIMRIYKVAAGPTLPDYWEATVAAATVGVPRWYRASVGKGTQRFEYSDNGSTWTTAVTSSDKTYSGVAGSAQLVFGLGGGATGTFYYDYFGYNFNASTFTKAGGTSNWSTATEWTKTPNAMTDLDVVSGELVVDQNPSINTITLYPGAKLTLNNGKTLTSLSTVTLQSDATATGTFVNNGGTLTAASATVQQYVTSGRNWYLSSPISNGTSAAFDAVNSSTNKLYVYDETTNTWPQITDNSTNLTKVKGYVANLPSSGTITFTGSLNDGDQSIALTKSTGSFAGFNLVGNPYPSFLDWHAVSVANAGVTSSIWYRTKTAADAYTFDTYNATADLGTSNGVKAVTKLIPPMQAFWVHTNAATTLSMTNAMRSHEDVSGNRLKSTNVANQNVVRLKLENGENSDEAIVFDNFNALNGIDAYDSPKMPAAAGAVPQLYSIVDGGKLAINGVQSLIDREMPIGFNTGLSGAFTIRMNPMSTVEGDVRVFLKDKHLNTEYDLSSGEGYAFNSEAVSDDNRFSLVAKTATKLSEVVPSTGIRLYEQSGQLTVHVAEKLTSDASVSVYNALGQRIATRKLSDQTTNLQLPARSGILVLKVQNAGSTTVFKTTTH
jgi:hypothetical protein